MALPPRAAAFLNRLERFLQEDPMRDFVREALRRFVGSEADAEPEQLEPARSYALYAHRDAEGRGAVDRFLGAHGAALPPDEREVYERLRESIFGFFEVERLEPGRGMRLRRVGTDERFEVVEVAATQTLQVGQGVFVYLVPYRGHYELAGTLLFYPPDLVYSIERTLRRNPDVKPSELSDPVWFHSQLEQIRGRPAPAENRLEAELMAEQVFADLGLPWKVEELQRRFQTMTSFGPLLNEVPDDSLRGEEDLHRLTEALMQLWNRTPRDELDGLSPDEKAEEAEGQGIPSIPEHLVTDFLETVAREVDLSALPDDEARHRAIEAVMERWGQEPQDALGGRAPNEIFETGMPLGARELAGLPAPGRPLWTPESRLEKLHELLRAERFEGALYVACRIARSGDPIPEELFGRFLDGVDGEILTRFWTELSEGVPEGVRSALARLALARIDQLRDVDALTPAVRFLARGEPAEHMRLFEILLGTEDDPLVQDAAAEGLARAGAPGADRLLLRQIEESETSEEATLALALSLTHGAVDAIPAAVRAFLDHLVDESLQEVGTSPLGELPFELDAIGLGSELSFRVCCSEFVLPPSDASPDDDDDPAESISDFVPVDDPAGARRAARVLSPERQARIRELRRADDDVGLIELQGELALEAIELASRENPAFAELGARLSALASALLDPERIRGLPQDDRDELSILVAMILVKALRGRDFRREAPPELEDRAKLLELLRVDEEWLREDIVARAASLLSEEDLLPIAESRDLYSAANGLTLLAALNPREHFLRAVEHLHELALPTDERLGWAARVSGDTFLDAILAGMTADSWPDWEADACSWLSIIATERAREVFRDHLDGFLESVRSNLSVDDLVEAACALADRDIALKVARALETSGIRLGEIGTDRAKLRYLLQALFDLTDVTEDVEAVLDRAAAGADEDEEPPEEEGWDEADEYEDGEEDRDDEDDDAWDTGEDRSSWFTGEAPRRSILDSLADEPYRREAPKVGRNDPCPCGSGKKYKRCCGRGK